MPKQEELLEGVERFLVAEVAEPIHPKKLAKLIMQYLDSKDVRIVKVVPGVYPLIEPLVLEG